MNNSVFSKTMESLTKENIGTLILIWVGILRVCFTVRGINLPQLSKTH